MVGAKPENPQALKLYRSLGGTTWLYTVSVYRRADFKVLLVIAQPPAIGLEYRQDGRQVLFVSAPAPNRTGIHRPGNVLIGGRVKLLLVTFFIKAVLLLMF